MKVGYVRVSTEEQNEGRQLKAMEEHGVDAQHIYIDKRSGKDTKRPGLAKMIDFIREGDTVLVLSFDRAARSTKDLLDIVERIHAKGAEFVSLKENIDTATPQGKFMLTVFGALAELERTVMLERQREGIAIAKAEHKYHGRQPVKYDRDAFEKEVVTWKAGKQTAKVTMEKLGLKRNTFYRRVADWETVQAKAIRQNQK